jgi:uncharacterized protein (DUF983 family)
MSKFTHSLLCKCPICGKTDMFTHSAFNLLKFINMHPKCAHCQANFHPEPGYYMGAMYISYIFNSFIFLFSALMLTFYFEKSMTFTLLTLVGMSVVFLPYTLRMSRSMWLWINDSVDNADLS